MGRFVNPDNQAFKFALNSEIYVDKSGLINYTNRMLCTEQRFICNSRPRRFGKSMTAKMLSAYYSKGADSKDMFSSLEIAQSPEWEKNLNKYDVIYFDVQGCVIPAGGPMEVVSYINDKVIEELKITYPDVIGNNVKALSEALSIINDRTGSMFIIIIDEWDVLIRDDANNQKVQDEYISFLRGLFKGYEPDKYIALAYMTGILPIKRQKTQSALNNFKEYTMLYPGFMSKYIGFTEDEVDTLCRNYSFDIEEIKRWYDGYILKGEHIYNPMAVVNAVIDGECRSYWSDTSSYDIVVPLINMNYDGLKESIIELVSGREVYVDIGDFQNDVSFDSKDDVMTYLIHLGYLAYNEKKKTAFIPNEEIRGVMVRAVRKKKWNKLIEWIGESESLIDATLRLDGKAVAAQIEKIHDKYASEIKYNDENALSSVLTIAYLATMDTYFNPVRELPSGKGFADFVYIPKPEFRDEYPALVVELKWNRDAESAIDQIKEKNYPDSIKEYTDNILLVGISYDRKTKMHECRIEKL